MASRRPTRTLVSTVICSPSDCVLADFFAFPLAALGSHGVHVESGIIVGFLVGIYVVSQAFCRLLKMTLCLAKGFNGISLLSFVMARRHFFALTILIHAYITFFSFKLAFSAIQNHSITNREGMHAIT